MSSQQLSTGPSMSQNEMKARVEETHKALTRHFADLGKRYADLEVDAPSWTTSKASGGAVYVIGYLQVDCNLNFSDSTNLTFSGKGLGLGFGGTGSVSGQAILIVDPKTLKGAPGITFEAFGYVISVVIGGFHVNWYRDGTWIGHGEFFGLGVSLNTPGGGWGSFS